MFNQQKGKKQNYFQKLRKIVSLILCFVFFLSQTGFAQIAGELDFAGHFAGLQPKVTGEVFRPVHLRYFSFDQQTNQFKVLLDKGDTINLTDLALKANAQVLLDYFLIGVTVPDDAFWVNLRPQGQDKIIDARIERTDIGKILLEADVQLKKDTAQATSPETAQGKLYWEKLYKKAAELYGNQNVTIPTLTRPWIVPNEIIIRESATGSAYIYKATLKVMLEVDHFSSKNDPLNTPYQFSDARAKALNEYSSQLIRETVIPNLTKEINSAKKYAALRQVYYSLVLARWFKNRFNQQDNAYSNLINQSNLTGLTSKEAWSKSTYFNAYQKSFKDGEYNLKTPVQTSSGPVIRSYFSGGADLSEKATKDATSEYTALDNAGENINEEELSGVVGEVELNLNSQPPAAKKSTTVSSEQKELFTPEQATAKFNAFKIISSQEKIEWYFQTAKENKYDWKRILNDLKKELASAREILSKTKPKDELNELMIKDDSITIEQLDILRGESEFILQMLPAQNGFDNLEQIKRIKEVFVKYPEISKMLLRCFEAKFAPGYIERTDKEEFFKISSQASREIKNLGDDYAKEVLGLALGLIKATLKTDYYVENRTELFFRFNPAKLVEFDRNGVLGKNPPFASIWVHIPYGAFGAHSRMANVARGGLRALNPNRKEAMNGVFAESNALAAVQHNKHIDIPEGGSKGVFYSFMGLNSVVAAIGYADALINNMLPTKEIVTKKDYWMDPLELGPDEGTAGLTGVITALAWMRGLDSWRVIITGKSDDLFGTQHDDNNLLEDPREGNHVTSQGAMQHAVLLIKWLREIGAIKSKDQDPINLSFTGGMDGDVGSGNLEIAMHHYGKNATIRAISDGTAAIFDPQGLNHEALLEMYTRKSPGKNFPVDKLGKGGFVAEVKYGNTDDCYVDLGPESLQYMNTRAFDPEFIAKLGVDKTYRLQARLTEGGSLVTVERDGNNQIVKARVHKAYLRDVLFLVAKADVLITGGGIRNSINDKNWELFFDAQGVPTTVGINHGANVFCSPGASINLENAGVFIEPDFMANSVGVETSSRMEVDRNLIFNPEEMSKDLARSYFKQVLTKFLENARWKFFAVRLEAAAHPGESVVTNVAPKISEEIIALAGAIQSSGLISDPAKYSPEIIAALRGYFPDVSDIDRAYGSTLDRVFARMPAERIQLIISKLLAKEVVLNLGTGFVDQLVSQSGKTQVEIVQAYLEVAKNLKTAVRLSEIVNAEDLLVNQQLEQLSFLRDQARKSLTQAIGKSDGPVNQGADVNNTLLDTGGIDLRTLPMTIRPIGSFADLKFMLPKVNNLASFDLEKELGQIKQMVAAGIIPSGVRVKEFVAAGYAKGQLGDISEDLAVCLVDICKLEEQQVFQTSAELKEALVIVDSVQS